MILPVTFFGAEASGLGALGIDLKAFIIQLITFILAYVALRYFAFGRIVKLLRSRRETIEQGVRLGEEMQKQRAKLDENIEEKLRGARSQADDIIASANETGRQAIREAEDKARAKADGILDQAKQNIAQDSARARQQLEKELVGLVADATEAVLEEKVDSTKDRSLIQKFLQRQA